MTIRSAFSAVAVVLLSTAIACAPPPTIAEGEGEGEGEGEVDTRALPPFFRFEATAHAVEAGFTVDCLLDWHFELQEEIERSAQVLAYSGIAGGEVSRSLLDDTGAGVAFSADSFGEVIVTWTQPDALEIDIPINETAIERIWLNLASLDGALTGPDGQTAEGGWTCAPFDVEQGGILDDTVFAPGEWHTTPEPAP